MTLEAAMLAPRDRLSAVRDRLFRSARFRQWAARFPLTRRIARGRARAAFDLCAGFVYSQVLLACVRLHVLDVLAERPHTVPALARRLSLPVEATERLVRAAAAIGLVARRGADRYGLGDIGAAIVGEPAIVAMVEHNALVYADLADPVALLRGERCDTGLARYWAYAGAAQPDGLPSARISDYSALMAASLPLVAGEVLSAYPFARHRCVLDVGGGEGAFVCAVARRYPGLCLRLFDLPPVAQRARARFEREGLHGRAAAVGGDFRQDALPTGADLVTLVRVVHDHDDADVLALLRNVRRALPADGVVLIAEPMSGVPGVAHVADAYFGFYLLAMGQGRARSFAELAGLLAEAGFGRARPIATGLPLQTSIVVASGV
jgi:demethylspheroidene O-methyltransferase